MPFGDLYWGIYLYQDFCRFLVREWRGAVVVEVVVLECIVFVQF